MADRFARFAIPDEGGLALVGDADGGNVVVADVGSADGVCYHSDLAGPDFVCIMFDPSRLREELGKFFLGDGDDFA